MYDVACDLISVLCDSTLARNVPKSSDHIMKSVLSKLLLMQWSPNVDFDRPMLDSMAASYSCVRAGL